MMIRIYIIAILSILSTATSLSAQSSIHQFVVKDIKGNDYPMKQLKGKKVLIVNTASKCGNTPQYKELQELYNQYKDSGLIVIGFPANNFAKQEPGTNQEILDFCTENYDVTFPLMSKISVKGDDIHPLYQWLTNKDENGVEDSKVKWNFQKYLIDEDGKLIAHFSPKTKPMNPKIVEMIQ
jgi:glutathione peroxidase